MRTSAVLLALALGAGSPALAGEPVAAPMQVPLILPYDGLLDLDGAPSEGPLDVRFTLYDAAGQVLWQEEWSRAAGRPVVLRGGHFHAPLGRYVDLTPALTGGGPRLLGLAIKTADEVAWAELAGRQQLDGAAYGLWAIDAPSLDVAGALTVGGDAAVADAVDLGRAGLTSASDVQADEGRFFRLQADALQVLETADILVPRAADRASGGAFTVGSAEIGGDLTAQQGGLAAAHLTLTAAELRLPTTALRSPSGRLLSTDSNQLLLDADGFAETADFRRVGITQMGELDGAQLVLRVPGEVSLAQGLSKVKTAANAAYTVGGDLNVGDLTVSGALAASQLLVEQCSVCLQYRRGNVTRHSCVSLNGSNTAGRFNVDSAADAQSQFSLVYTCAGVGTSAGAGLAPQ